MEPTSQQGKHFREVNRLLSYTNAMQRTTEINILHTCGQNCDRDVAQLAHKTLAVVGPSHAPRLTNFSDDDDPMQFAYSDGSLAYPKSNLSFGTFATWQPRGDLARSTPEELEFAVPIQQRSVVRSGGLLKAGIIAGVYNSLTRTELAAVISLLSSPGPITIVLDNRGVVDRGNAILARKSKRHRAWDLLPDGDLWKIFETTACEKGFDNINLFGPRVMHLGNVLSKAAMPRTVWAIVKRTMLPKRALKQQGRGSCRTSCTSMPGNRRHT